MLLALSVGALGGAGLRAASLAAPRGLERIVAVAALAAAAIVFESLALGLFALGGSSAALALAAGATWLAARALLPAPAVRPIEEVLAWWGARSARERAAAGALAGLLIAWTAWLLRTPALGVDTLVYHLPEALDWIHSGHTGSVETVFPALPVGSYPLVNEVMVAWGMAIGRSYVAASLLAPAAYVVLACSCWLGLRALRVPPTIAALATAFVCSVPTLSIWQLYGAQTDLPALAWLAAGGALAARSLERPPLAGPALVAAGLAAGTKTTVLPLASLVVVLVLVAHRRRLRALARPVGLGLAAAAAVGGVWYLRNLFEHGSPLWPFVSAPWGDPVPQGFLSKPLNVHFAERPGATLSRLHSQYVHLFAGGIPVLAGGILAWVLDRRRAVVAASAVAGLSLLLWTQGPLTGVADDRALDSIVLSSIRYLIGGLAVAALALALAARRPGAPRLVATALLGAGLAWNVVRDHSFGYPSVPSLALPAGGLAIGAVVAVLAGARPTRVRLPWLATPAALIAIGALLAPLASGYLGRHARTGLVDAGLIGWISQEPRFRDGHDPVAAVPTNIGALAGDRLQHVLRLVRGDEPCALLEARARHGWVVVRRDAVTGPFPARACFAVVRPAYADPTFRVYGPAQ